MIKYSRHSQEKKCRYFGSCVGVMICSVLILAMVLKPSPLAAYEVGNWRSVCMAPNWQTGEIEPVAEANVSIYPIRRWFARTHRLPDGSWRMEFNENFIRRTRLSEEARKYVFFHECAHALKDEASEHRTDCEALNLMRREGLATTKALRDIRYAYVMIMRSFPTGGPCEPQMRNYEQTIALQD
ncbi:MAG: hypothetical protein ACRBCJ_13480 [Hyphomicrobiaceae bacterium]